MRFGALVVVLATGIVKHANIGHAALGFGCPLALLPHAGGVEADVGTALAVRIALPGPGLALLVEGHLVVQQFRESLSSGFSNPFDR